MKKKEDSVENPKSPVVKRPLTTNSIDVYAVQCAKCYKWRVIDEQEEYEEIRSKFSDEPYACSNKSGVSCDDPADIEYDASRTWVIDKPNIPKTPEGFKRSLILRKDFSKLDAYYISPSGKKMKTRNEVAAFLESNSEFKGVSIEEFNFHTPKVMEDTVPEFVERKDVASGKKGGAGSAKRKSNDGE